MRGNLEKAGRPEIGHLDDALLGDEHVSRSQVAMDDALAMRVIHRVADLARVVERARQLERAFTLDDRFERVAGHVLHHDEEDVVLLLGGDHSDDVGMTERGEQTGLAGELAEVQILFVRDLDRDFLFDPRVFGEIHAAETATPQRRENAVFPDRLPAKEHLCR